MAASARYCPSCLSSTTAALLRRSTATHTQEALAPLPCYTKQQQQRTAVTSANAAKYKRRDTGTAPTSRKKKTRTSYLTPDLKDAHQFPLLDAIRYLRAAEVGRPPAQAKYELHLRLKTPKNGAVVRNRLRLPHAVRTDLRIAVIAEEGSKSARDAAGAGASLVGTESIFAAVREGRVEFERCICAAEALPALSKAGLGRVLGPRGLMPSVKTGTVVSDVGASVREMVGASEYRERRGVVRLAVGQLGFTPEEVARNIRAVMESVNRDIAALSDRIAKEIHEVVLSSTNGPGLSLSGEVRAEGSVAREDLGTV